MNIRRRRHIAVDGDIDEVMRLRSDEAVFEVITNNDRSRRTALGLEAYDEMNLMISRWSWWQDCKFSISNCIFLFLEHGVSLIFGACQRAFELYLYFRYPSRTSNSATYKLFSINPIAPKREAPKKRRVILPWTFLNAQPPPHHQ